MSDITARDDLRRFGVGWTLFRLGYEGLHRALRFRMIICLKLEPEHLNPECVPPETPYEFRFLSREELLEFSRDPANQLSARVIERSLAKGDECFGTLDGEKLASITWFARGPTTVLQELRVQFDPDWVYSYSGYTKPEYRGQRLQALGTGSACQAYARRGYRGFLGNVEWQNVAGRRAWDYVGYRHYGTVYQIGLGRRALLLRTRGARRFGFRVERAMRRRHERSAPGESPALETGHAEERRIEEVGGRHHDETTSSHSYVIQDDRCRFVEWMLEKLRAAGRDPTALSYLDVGYGSGDAMELLSRAGCTRLTGLDLTPGRLDEASRARLPGARWVHATVERHPFPRASFDVVVAAYSLHQMGDPGVFLSLADESLRPGGWFFVLDFDADALLRRRHTRRRAYRYFAPVRWLLRHKPANASMLRRQPPVPIERDPAPGIFGFDEVRSATPDHDRYRLHRESHGTLAWLVRDVVVKESAFDRRLVGALRRADRFTRQLGPGYIQWIGGERRAQARSDS